MPVVCCAPETVTRKERLAIDETVPKTLPGVIREYIIYCTIRYYTYYFVIVSQRRRVYDKKNRLITIQVDSQTLSSPHPISFYTYSGFLEFLSIQVGRYYTRTLFDNIYKLVPFLNG